MVPTFHLADGAYAEFYEALLPDFMLAVIFFTALCYAVLGRRFERHQRAAVVLAAVLGIALAIGLVWWEQQHGYSIRDLGPIAVGLAIMFLAVAVYQAFRLAGGTVAGAGLAIAAAILIAWMLQVDWPVAGEIIQTIAGTALIIGLIALFSHHHAHPPATIGRGRPLRRPRSERVDVGNLYDDRYVSEKLSRRFGRLRKQADQLGERPRDAENVMQQLRRMLPAEGWLTERLARLREQAHRARHGHVARIDSIRQAYSKLNTEQRKQASQQLIAEYKSLQLDQRMERLDHAVAANEKRIRELTQKAQNQLGKNEFRGLTETLKEAEKLQKHNSKLFERIEQTEKKIERIVQRAAASSGPPGETSGAGGGG
jgi:hypothetical protein